VYDSCAQWYADTHEQFLKMSVCLGLGLLLCVSFGLAFCVFFGFNLDYFVLEFFAFVVLGSVSLALPPRYW